MINKLVSIYLLLTYVWLGVVGVRTWRRIDAEVKQHIQMEESK